MLSTLIVSASKVMTDFFIETLAGISYDEPTVVKTCGDARRLLVERAFDLCIINSPLTDETGYKLATDIIGAKVNQVILVLKQDIACEIAAKVEDYGVFTVEKPVSGATFQTALKMAGAAYRRFNAFRNENEQLKRKLSDLKLINRAKCLLIEKEGLSEDEAHKKIEQEAMRYRLSRTRIAAEIINQYDE